MLFSSLVCQPAEFSFASWAGETVPGARCVVRRLCGSAGQAATQQHLHKPPARHPRCIHMHTHMHVSS